MDGADDGEDMVKSLTTYMKDTPFTLQNQPIVLNTSKIFESANELLQVLSPEEGAIPSLNEANLPLMMGLMSNNKVPLKRPSIDKLESYKIPKLKRPTAEQENEVSKNKEKPSPSAVKASSSSESRSIWSAKLSKTKTSMPKITLLKRSSSSETESHSISKKASQNKSKKVNHSSSSETKSLKSGSSHSSSTSSKKYERNKIKKEVTSDDETFYRRFKTRNQIQKRNSLKISDFIDLTKVTTKIAITSTCSTKWETTSDLSIHNEPMKANATVSELYRATVFKPAVFCDVFDSINLIDEVPISEKECAAKIFRFVYTCHKLKRVGKQFDEVITELHFYYPSKMEENISHLPKAKVMLLGKDLLGCLEQLYVKNLNFERFLEVVVSKINAEYKVELKSYEVVYLLLEMLEPNQQLCFNTLQKEILYKAKVFFKHYEIKKEKEDQVLFTQKQLDLLGQQIRTYLVLVERQRSLERAEEQLTLWQLTREVKQELRSMEDSNEAPPLRLAIKPEQQDKVKHNLNIIYTIED